MTNEIIHTECDGWHYVSKINERGGFVSFKKWRLDEPRKVYVLQGDTWVHSGDDRRSE
jgi:hypothetical protein